MKVLAFIVMLFSVFISMYFQKKSSKFLREEFKTTGFLRKLEMHPTSFNNDEYSKKEGIVYRNISMLVLFLGLLVFILLILLSN